VSQQTIISAAANVVTGGEARRIGRGFAVRLHSHGRALGISWCAPLFQALRTKTQSVPNVPEKGEDEVPMPIMRETNIRHGPRFKRELSRRFLFSENAW